MAARAAITVTWPETCRVAVHAMIVAAVFGGPRAVARIAGGERGVAQLDDDAGAVLRGPRHTMMCSRAPNTARSPPALTNPPLTSAGAQCVDGAIDRKALGDSAQIDVHGDARHHSRIRAAVRDPPFCPGGSGKAGIECAARQTDSGVGKVRAPPRSSHGPATHSAAHMPATRQITARPGGVHEPLDRCNSLECRVDAAFGACRVARLGLDSHEGAERDSRGGSALSSPRN